MWNVGIHYHYRNGFFFILPAIWNIGVMRLKVKWADFMIWYKSSRLKVDRRWNTVIISEDLFSIFCYLMFFFFLFRDSLHVTLRSFGMLGMVLILILYFRIWCFPGEAHLRYVVLSWCSGSHQRGITLFMCNGLKGEVRERGEGDVV